MSPFPLVFPTLRGNFLLLSLNLKLLSAKSSVWKCSEFVVWKRVKKSVCQEHETKKQTDWNSSDFILPDIDLNCWRTWLNPVPDMPILSFSNSGVKKDMMSKIWTKENTFVCVENIVVKGQIPCYEQFLLFPQCFQRLSVVDASK